jgi:predicted amino acid dehydrogenase
MAADAGCRVVGLGGYTSIVTGNCRHTKTGGIAKTSGNALTVGMSLAAVDEEVKKVGIDLAESCVGIVGACGNIGSICAVLLAPRVKQMVLVVRRPNAGKVHELLASIRDVAPRVDVKVSESADSLRACSVIVASSSSAQPIVFPRHLGAGPLVIADISVPPDVADDVELVRPDVGVIRGGIVRLPCNDDFIVPGVPLERGHVFACMAETMLMGLEGETANGSFESIQPHQVNQATAWAEKHGFKLGRIKFERSY